MDFNKALNVLLLPEYVCGPDVKDQDSFCVILVSYQFIGVNKIRVLDIVLEFEFIPVLETKESYS